MADNNLFWQANCPAQMHDGRQFTDYYSPWVQNKYVQEQFQVPDHHSYRKQLQLHGQTVMQSNLQYLESQQCQCGDQACRLE